MAKEIGSGKFVGPISNISIYKMKGHDQLIMRKKGGPTKRQIKQSPRFEHVRRNNKEFGGCSRAGSQVRFQLWLLQDLADHNISGPINAMMKHIQRLDTVSDHGKRSILISQHGRLLEGFNLNKENLFDSLVQTPVRYNIDKITKTATIDIPALVPGLNFTQPGKFSHCRFILTLGVLPDWHITDDYYFAVSTDPKEKNPYSNGFPREPHTEIFTQWLPATEQSPAATYQLKIEDAMKAVPHTMMLGIGISFGIVRHGTIEAIKYAGGAKILAME